MSLTPYVDEGLSSPFTRALRFRKANLPFRSEIGTNLGQISRRYNCPKLPWPSPFRARAPWRRRSRQYRIELHICRTVFCNHGGAGMSYVASVSWWRVFGSSSFRARPFLLDGLISGNLVAAGGSTTAASPCVPLLQV